MVADARNGGNIATVLGDDGASPGRRRPRTDIPRQGLGNAALGAVGTEEQKAQFGKLWIAMAITEPNAGSDSAAIRDDRPPRRRRVGPQRREDIRHGRRACGGGRRLGDARSFPRTGGDQVVPRAEKGRAGWRSSDSTTSWASARPIRRRSSSKTVECRGKTSSAAPRLTRASRSPES